LILESKIYSLLKNYDDFIGYSSCLREKAKLIKENKSQIITFICSEDFKYIYEKGKDKVVMELFFGKEIVSKLY
ncbi:MAG: NAD(P)-dependent oxidoreductase, partial [Clostridiales bacterium]|nr:NAD(P)-dependent oxidoreductase [Clostridiales bacterium]